MTTAEMTRKHDLCGCGNRKLKESPYCQSCRYTRDRETGMNAHIRSLVEAGDLVSNAPFRERYLWLLENDPDVSASVVCHRMDGLGFNNFVRVKQGRECAETSFLMRKLGISPSQPSNRNGRRIPGTYQRWIAYEMAAGFCKALDIAPVDAGV